jgi:hypothetical protein
VIYLPGSHRRRNHAGEGRGHDGEWYRVAGQPVLDAGFESLGYGRRQSANRDAAHQYSQARSDGSADQPEHRRFGEHVANDGDPSPADRAQHRDDGPSLGDGHGHRGVHEKGAYHQGNHRAHQGHVVHQPDAVTGPDRPHTRFRNDCPAVHRSGDRRANCAEIGARFRGDQYRVELTLSSSDTLRQSKWGKDIMPAVESGESVAAKHLGDADRTRAQLKLLAFRVADTWPDPHTVRYRRRLRQMVFCDSIFQGAAQSGNVGVGAQQQDGPGRRGRGRPDHRHCVRDSGNRGYICRYRVGKSRVGDAGHLQRRNAGDSIGKPVDRSADGSEDAEGGDQIHCGHCHYGDRGDRAPPMHSELTQAEQS